MSSGHATGRASFLVEMLRKHVVPYPDAFRLQAQRAAIWALLYFAGYYRDRVCLFGGYAWLAYIRSPMFFSTTDLDMFVLHDEIFQEFVEKGLRFLREILKAWLPSEVTDVDITCVLPDASRPTYKIRVFGANVADIAKRIPTVTDTFEWRVAELELCGCPCTVRVPSFDWLYQQLKEEKLTGKPGQIAFMKKKNEERLVKVAYLSLLDLVRVDRPWVPEEVRPLEVKPLAPKV